MMCSVRQTVIFDFFRLHVETLFDKVPETLPYEKLNAGIEIRSPRATSDIFFLNFFD